MRSSSAIQKTSRQESSLRPAEDMSLLLIRRREERCLEICEGMIDLTAALFNVSSKELRRSSRSAAGVARVRQITMYVAHVALGLSMKEIGRAFGRDRTTVLHACHLVENLRDNIEFDCMVQRVERVARTAFGYRRERADG